MASSGGPLTFLFTDIQGSARLWEAQPDIALSAISRHDDLIGDAVRRCGGEVFKSVGDGLCAVFTHPSQALNAALEIQRALGREGWETNEPLRVRVGIHTGEAAQVGDDFYGPALNRCARLTSLAHGGQVVVSQSAEQLTRDQLGDSMEFLDLGVHRLRDLVRPEHLFQLCHPDLPGHFPTLVGRELPPANLPQQLSAFIGRETELTELRSILNDHRFLTLTGTGGVGKTRLALELANRVFTEFDDGVGWIELATLTDPEGIAGHVAEGLGIPVLPSMQPMEALQLALREKRLLLILDNCEHLINAASDFIEQLLAAAPRVTILATSREVLNIEGEISWRVPGLSVPKATEDEHAAEYEAIQLFAERGRAANSDFRLTAANRLAVIEICRSLDGIPLAIELAAARTKVFTAEQIATRLSDRLNLLSAGPRHARPRHQTLRATIEWSYDLLSETEQASFSRYSVFSGGFSLQAAEAVAEGSTAVDDLTRLIEKSLLLLEDHDGDGRYRMLETLRAFGQERLHELPFVADVRRRHFAYFSALVLGAQSYLKGSEQADWLDLLDLEYDNIRAALDWGLSERTADGLRLAHDLADFWEMRARTAEGQRWLSHYTEQAPANAELAAALVALGRLEIDQGKLVSAEQRLIRAIEIARKEVDSPVEAAALNNLGNLAFLQGDFDLALQRYEASLAIRRELGDDAGVSATLSNLGNVARAINRFDEAVARYEQSMEIDRRLGDQVGVSTTLNNLGLVAQARGDVDSARQQFEQSLRLKRSLGDKHGIALTLHNLGLVAQYSGDMPTARQLYAESLALRREIGDRAGAAMILNNLAFLAHSQGDSSTARKHFAEALGTFSEVGMREGVLSCLEGLGQIAAETGDGARAAMLFGAVAAMRETLGMPLPENELPAHEARLASLRAELGDDFEVLWVQGRTSTQEQAIGIAFE